MQRVHFQVRVGVFNCQQILAKISFVIFDIVIKTKSNVVYSGNWTEWSAIWSEIIRVISKSNERAARVRFEITSMISD